MNGTLPRRVTRQAPKARRYAHFDDPLTESQVTSFQVTPGDVQRHSFLPLLGYEKTTRRMDTSVFPALGVQKIRDIRYASHVDSAIYSQYALLLNENYEKKLEQLQLSLVVLAYRSGLGYNAPFAKSLFDEIRTRRDCQVICYDVSKFFDGLNHKLLKSALCSTLDQDRLSDDWYKIFKRLTSFEYILREEIKARLGRVGKKRICSIDTFRGALRPLIHHNDRDCGIPQGTPLSGLLANIYMMGFDQRVTAFLHSLGGSYRRYSDDIAVVLPNSVSLVDAETAVAKLLGEYCLELNDDKTCRTKFGDAGCGHLTYDGDLLQYLGFTFDGTKTLIRPQSLRMFYARMKTNIRRTGRSAAKKGIPLKELRRRVLVGRFTHWGDSRNFVQYAFRAARDIGAPEIKRQLRNHVAIFEREWSKMVDGHS